jgi:hypothetical protein
VPVDEIVAEARVPSRPSAYRVAPSHGPNGGVAVSLDEAKAASRAACVRRRQEERDVLNMSPSGQVRTTRNMWYFKLLASAAGHECLIHV